MKRSRKWISVLLSAVVLSGVMLFPASRAEADVRVIRTRPHHGSCWGYSQPRRCTPVHVHTYALQERRSFIGYDHCGRPIYQVYYVQVRTCGCP